MLLDDIILGCKNGERKSQDNLVRQYAPKLLAICQRYCRDRELARDALQETFINIFKYVGDYSGQGSFEGWMKRIAVNNAIRLNSQFYKFNLVEDTQLSFNLETQVPNAIESMALNELMDIVKSLPDNYYVVFNMYVIEGFDHKEIADVLGIAESTSRAMLFRARHKLVEKLTPSDEAVNVDQRNISLNLNFH